MKPRPKPGSTLPLTRPPLERMLRIHQALQAGGYPNTPELARDLEVSTKSVQRDLDFMRDRLHLPIAHNREKNGYEFVEVPYWTCLKDSLKYYDEFFTLEPSAE